MNVLSVCSGVGGMDRGLEAAGMSVVGLCEFDPWAAGVLNRHWPDTPVHPDLTALDGSELHGRVDLVAGGTPCTDLSVAGRRAGLGGEHSRLFWDFCRVAAQSAASWLLWENVAGALSSNDGEDFAAVLWGLTGFRPAVPEDGWRTLGVCVGPERTAVWRLLDARWFGVAQRRRRVFVVAGPRDKCSLSILVEPESLPGGPRPGAPSREEVAGTLGGGSGGRGWCPDTDRMTFVPALTTAGPGRLDDQAARQMVLSVSENQRGEVLLTPYARQITTGGGKPGQGYPAVLLDADHLSAEHGVRVRVADEAARHVDEGVADVLGQIDGGAVGTDGHGNRVLGHAAQYEQPAREVNPAYPLAMRGRADGSELELGEADTYNALRAGDGGSSRQNGVLTPDLAVRRLTPRECERLMSWPDDWTRWTGDGREVADSHRYRMCGNGVVSNCAEWIGRRIMEATA